MLSRGQFVLRRLFSFVLALSIAAAGGFAIERLVDAGFIKSLLNWLCIGVAVTIGRTLAGDFTSYRKYVAACGGPDQPPSAFWATRGQMVVVGLGAAILIVLTLAARRHPDSWVSSLTAFAWPGGVGTILVFLLVARDWRDELKRRHAL